MIATVIAEPSPEPRMPARSYCLENTPNGLFVVCFDALSWAFPRAFRDYAQIMGLATVAHA
jgi:hypothetical protein